MPSMFAAFCLFPPVRCEKLEEGYLIGARISRMKPRERELFEEYLEEIGED